jgi:hypothetical protein
VLAVSSAWAGPFSVTSVETSGTTFGTGTSSATAAERMRITQGGLVGISNTSPIAKLDVVGTISASDAIQVSGSSLTCSSAIKGAIRYSNTSSTLEYCNSTAWTSLGPSATSVPSFSVHKNGTNQTVSSGAATLITWSTELIDTNNNFASNRFTPTIAGKYLVTATVRCGSATGYCVPILSKSGSTIAEGTAVSAASVIAGTFSIVVDMNGSSDYLEVYVYSNGSTTVEGSSVWTYFSGTLIAPYGQGGGGTATPAGSTADVQYNSAGALAADTGNFTYASGVLKAPTISATVHNGQYASFTTIFNPGSLSGNSIAANSTSSTLGRRATSPVR